MIDARGLRKIYGTGQREIRPLDGVDFTCERGEFVLLTGRSGTGKTTFLNVLAGLTLPTAGSVRIAGRDLLALSDHERSVLRWEMMGFVFQFPGLMAPLTVMENVLLPATLQGKAGKEAEARATPGPGRPPAEGRRLPGPSLGRGARSGRPSPAPSSTTRPSSLRTSRRRTWTPGRRQEVMDALPRAPRTGDDHRHGHPRPGTLVLRHAGPRHGRGSAGRIRPLKAVLRAARLPFFPGPSPSRRPPRHGALRFERKPRRVDGPAPDGGKRSLASISGDPKKGWFMRRPGTSASSRCPRDR